MVKKYKNIIFDWDGTVVSSIEPIVLSVQKAALDNNLNVPSYEHIAKGIGLSQDDQIERLFPVLSAKQKKRLYMHFINILIIALCY